MRDGSATREAGVLGHRARTGGPEEASWRLVCLPHAGGSAGSYVRWAAAAPSADAPRLVAVQYPGHETRFGERPLDSFEAVVDEFAGVLGELLDDGVPTALLGHSFGASVAAALAGRLPLALLVLSGRAAPGLRRPTAVPAEGETERWREWLRRLGGTPEEILRDPEALRLAIRCLRADLVVAAQLEAGDRAAALEQERLRVPALLTVAARADAAAPPAAVGAWAGLLSAGAVDHGTLLLDGGHFAILERPASVLPVIAAALGRPS